jgi:hypothetical protein
MINYLIHRLDYTTFKVFGLVLDFIMWFITIKKIKIIYE